MRQKNSVPAIHVMPDYAGEPLHAESRYCWCDPVLSNPDDVADGCAEVWTHNRPRDTMQ